MGVTLEQVDAGVVAKYSGHTVTLVDGSVVTVPVFMSTPHEWNVPNRTFPSITALLTDVREDLEEAEPNGDTVVSSSPFVLGIEDTWYRLDYQIHLWVVNDTRAMRELERKIEQRERPRGTVTVDGNLYWAFRSKQVSMYEHDKDRIILHAVHGLSVRVPIGYPDNEYSGNVVNEIELGFYSVDTGLVQPGGVATAHLGSVACDGSQSDAVGACKTKDSTIAYNATDFWYPV